MVNDVCSSPPWKCQVTHTIKLHCRKCGIKCFWSLTQTRQSNWAYAFFTLIVSKPDGEGIVNEDFNKIGIVLITEHLQYWQLNSLMMSFYTYSVNVHATNHPPKSTCTCPVQKSSRWMMHHGILPCCSELTYWTSIHEACAACCCWRWAALLRPILRVITC